MFFYVFVYDRISQFLVQNRREASFRALFRTMALKESTD